MNEVTKSIERVQAKLVVMAEDVSPPEILFHIPLLCKKKIFLMDIFPLKKSLETQSELTFLQAPLQSKTEELETMVF